MHRPQVPSGNADNGLTLPAVGLVRIAILATSLLLSLARPVHAAWDPNGVQVADYPARERVPIATDDGFGGVFVAWVDQRDIPNYPDTDVYLQRLTFDGQIAPGWTPSGVPVTTAPFSQYPLNIGPDGDGGCYVKWVDFLNANVRLQRITSSGAIAPGWPSNGVALNPAGGDRSGEGSLVLDGTGGVFVTFGSQISGTMHAHVQHLTGGGQVAPGWPPNGLRIGNLAGPQLDPVGVSDGAGGIIVVWEEVRVGPKVDLFAIRIGPDGATSPGWPENGIDVCTAYEAQSLPRVVTDGAGGALIAWVDYRAVPVVAPNLDEYTDVYAHHVLPTGTMDARWPSNGLPICTKPHFQSYVRTCSDGQGGMIITWEDFRADPDVYAQRVRADGTLAPGWAVDGNPVGIVPGYDHVTSPPAPDGAGGAYFAWQSQPGVLRHARTQHLTATGQAASGAGPMGLLLVATPGEQLDPWLASDGYGGAIAAWADTRLCGSCDQIYALRIAGNGPTAVAVSLVRAEAEPGLARLTWQVTGDGSSFAIERKRNGATFVPIATPSPTGAGRIAYEDPVPEPGRYSYRLTYSDEGVRHETPEVQVDVPSAFTLSLAGFTPNPISSASLSVSFTLPKQAPGSLALYDVTGRELTREDLTGLGPGRHALRLGAHSLVPAGVYWMRLIHADRTLSARGVVVR